MKTRHITVGFVYLLLLSMFQLGVYACCPGDPGSCYVCQDGVWVQYGDCWSGCPTCETCELCWCMCTSQCCSNSDCSGECKSCVNCSCVDDDTKCSICQNCSGGNCVLKPTSECTTDSDCQETLEYCYLCKCKCHNCYEWKYVSPNTLFECPECSNEEGGCYSSAFWIQQGYDYFTGGSPPDGGMGLCDNPTKTEQVGYHVFCVDYDTDVEKIVEIVIKLGLDLSTYVDCGKCVLTRSPSACYKCIIGLIIGEIVDESPCLFVDGCEHCYDWDENCSVPIEEKVVDWDKVEEENVGFCYPGLDWP